MNHTLGTVLPAVKRILGQCSDTEAIDYLNLAQEILLYKGDWPGTYIRFRVCAEGSCVTWPRQIETIKSWSICGVSGKLVNEWYEFLDAGPGELTDTTCGYEDVMADRGMACCFDDIRGTNKKLRVYADVAETAGSVITLQGYDENGNWIRTQVSGEWIDGEQVVLNSLSPQLTIHKFMALTGVIKPETNGIIRVYEYNTATTAQRVIAFYEWDETHPVYRRSIIPNIASLATEDCGQIVLTVIGKMRFIPARNDNDWLIIQNKPAILRMVRSLLKEDQNLDQESEVYEGKSLRSLREQLNHHLGDGTLRPVKWQGTETWGAGVANLQ